MGGQNRRQFAFNAPKKSSLRMDWTKVPIERWPLHISVPNLEQKATLTQSPKDRGDTHCRSAGWLSEAQTDSCEDSLEPLWLLPKPPEWEKGTPHWCRMVWIRMFPQFSKKNSWDNLGYLGDMCPSWASLLISTSLTVTFFLVCT